MKLPNRAKTWEYENNFLLSCQNSRMAKMLAYYELYKIASKIKGDFVLGGVFFNKIVPTVSIFQNILPFIKDETKKYSFFERIKLLIQKKIYINTFSKSDGLIFLSNFSKKY